LINRLDLLTWVNIAHTDDEILDRIDSYADLIAAGLLHVHTDHDAVMALPPTDAGRAKLPPTLPTATA
jgi:hypothetical protein